MANHFHVFQPVQVSMEMNKIIEEHFDLTPVTLYLGTILKRHSCIKTDTCLRFFWQVEGKP